jgi:hydroxyacylglutathione hydrolase
MIFEKFIDMDLGHVSYLVACDVTKEAFVVDPRRDIKEYEAFIEKNNLTLKYIFNTHTHADYVGGHLELSSKYAAVSNIFSHIAPIDNFEVLQAVEGGEFFIGNSIKIKIMETPGHTPFDICLLVSENNIDKLIFTGDLLFIGDIGRPDLLGEDSLQFLSNASYESACKIWNLSDGIMVLPSHVHGSLCGQNLSRQYFSTIGIEKSTNRSLMLCQASKEEYVQNLLSQDIETPIFFKKMASINIAGPRLITDVMNNIQSVEFDDISNCKDVQIVDIRHPALFHRNHIKNSINIYESSNVSFIAGSILDYGKDIYIISGTNSNFDNFIVKLLRVGLDQIRGIINCDFSLIHPEYLTSSQTVPKGDITKEFVNVLLDKNCSNLGTVIQVDISCLSRLDLSKYDKVFFSCKHGFKSSAVTNLVKHANVFWIEQ